ncbi:MAG: A/G-specific adenine glycosylase [Clostridia bacterium]|nr:A/G-specific adenine glycosylase [Clostridia bacterium]
MNAGPRAADMLPGAERLPALAQPILAWYARVARSLPWRAEPTPYRVWVSEVMLQQTRVETVLPYFERFVAALPDVGALAGASEPLLLKLWEGLGYYSRVRNMHKAARVMTERFGGRLPGSYEQLLTLPGIGEYSAGAVASIAFGIAVPAVDGNVLRVLSRLLACRADISQPRVKESFRAAARLMMPGEAPGDFNQAMMELGAVVCLPNAAPRCGECPASQGCEALRQHCADELPVRAPKKPRRIEQRTVVAVVSRGRVLLGLRPETGLLAHMRELPNFESFLSQDEIALRLAQWGAQGASLQRLEDGRHIFTHIEWRMQGYLARTEPFTPPDGFIWADEASLRDEHALPGAFKTYARHLPLWLAGNE